MGPKRITVFPEDKVRKQDPELTSFFNINSPADLDKAKDMISTMNGFETTGE